MIGLASYPGSKSTRLWPGAFGRNSSTGDLFSPTWTPPRHHIAVSTGQMFLPFFPGPYTTARYDSDKESSNPTSLGLGAQDLNYCTKHTHTHTHTHTNIHTHTHTRILTHTGTCTIVILPTFFITTLSEQSTHTIHCKFIALSGLVTSVAQNSNITVGLSQAT